jgi:hypothetical protein
MKDIKKDFEAFVSDDHPAASSYVLGKIHTQLQNELPSPWKAATKLGVAHLISSFVILMACAQFGVRLFFSGHGLMHYFMQISPTFCMSFCGGLYLASTFLLARVILTRDEFLVIYRSKVLSILSLAFMSLGGFALVSHEVTFQAGILWLFGAIVGAELASLSKARVQSFLEKV